MGKGDPFRKISIGSATCNRGKQKKISKCRDMDAEVGDEHFFCSPQGREGGPGLIGLRVDLGKVWKREHGHKVTSWIFDLRWETEINDVSVHLLLELEDEEGDHAEQASRAWHPLDPKLARDEHSVRSTTARDACGNRNVRVQGVDTGPDSVATTTFEASGAATPAAPRGHTNHSRWSPVRCAIAFLGRRTHGRPPLGATGGLFSRGRCCTQRSAKGRYRRVIQQRADSDGTGVPRCHSPIGSSILWEPTPCPQGDRAAYALGSRRQCLRNRPN